MMRVAVAVAGSVAVALAAGCSSGTPSANQLVCRHYLAQRDWVKHLVQPTVADGFQFITDVNVDEGQSVGRLHADLLSMLETMNAGGDAYYKASARVYSDCA